MVTIELCIPLLQWNNSQTNMFFASRSAHSAVFTCYYLCSDISSKIVDLECVFEYVLYIRPTTLGNYTIRTNRSL